MTTKQAAQRNARYWGISLSLLLAAVGLTAYALLATPRVAIPAGPIRSLSLPSLRSLLHTLRTQSVIRYLWPEPVALDAAQQGVMKYLQVHNAVRPGSTQITAHDPKAESGLNYVPAPAADPAVQGVVNYINVHEVVRLSQIIPLDPNARSVYDYLRAHGQLR